MTTELWLLAGAIALALVQVSLATFWAQAQLGNWRVGPRDEPRTLAGVAGRLDRAYRNLLESLPWFAALVLLLHVTERSGQMSLIGAHLYLWGRVGYVPAYVSGIPWFRTVFWWAATSGIVLLLIDVAV
jgi:uncharacterized MAPEG superfamily protein